MRLLGGTKQAWDTTSLPTKSAIVVVESGETPMRAVSCACASSFIPMGGPFSQIILIASADRFHVDFVCLWSEQHRSDERIFA